VASGPLALRRQKGNMTNKFNKGDIVTIKGSTCGKPSFSGCYIISDVISTITTSESGNYEINTISYYIRKGPSSDTILDSEIVEKSFRIATYAEKVLYGEKLKI